MEGIGMEMLGSLLEPASWAAFVGATMTVVLVVTRRVIQGRFAEKWERFTEKLFAVIGAIAAGLILIKSDDLSLVVAAVVTGALVTGLSVGLYRYIGDLVFGKPKKPGEGDAEEDSEEDDLPVEELKAILGDDDGETTVPETPLPKRAAREKEE